ncbi:MAG: hypothetical protein HW416_2772 [Chloroflexi bacterium]|nr:hypothetical protein [Chloroflexota bacterium]
MSGPRTRFSCSSWRIAAAVVLLATVGVGCGPGQPGRPATEDQTRSGAPPVRKTMTIGVLSTVAAYAPWDLGNPTGGSAVLAEMHMASLVSQDVQGNREARLAARVPSLDDGTLSLLPDGGMRTTWALRPNVLWHDGTSFTAEDLVFSSQVMRNPQIPLGGGALGTIMRQIDSVQAADAHTLVITWRTPFYRALDLGTRDFWPFPKHLLGEAFQGDIQAFTALPYFTTEYVHLGPFRLAEFHEGELQVFRRFDQYFLGTPRLDSIVVRTVRDPNALLANLKAHAVDIASEQTLTSDLFIDLRDEWQQTGEGTVLARQYTWRYLQVQMDPQYSRPVELSQDVRIRRALLRAIDRDALRAFLYPGFAGSGADTFILDTDPRMAIVGQPFAQYSYDARTALQELAESGWNRGTDGRLLNQEGRPVQIDVRGSVVDSKGVALVADYWRRIGIEAAENISPPALARDPERQSTFTGVDMTARGSGESMLPNFDGRLLAGPENRWSGQNKQHYANPALDRIIDAIYGTVDDAARGELLRQAGVILASDLPGLPTHFTMGFVALSRGVRALTDDFATTGWPGSGPQGLMSRNAHLWDRD